MPPVVSPARLAADWRWSDLCGSARKPSILHATLRGGRVVAYVKMRRSSLAWVLSLLLVLAQHGALLHGIGHLSHSDGTTGAAIESPADAGPCAACEAFAQVANPAVAAADGLAVSVPGLLPTPEPRDAVAGTDAPTPRSRGPPQV